MPQHPATTTPVPAATTTPVPAAAARPTRSGGSLRAGLVVLGLAVGAALAGPVDLPAEAAAGGWSLPPEAGVVRAAAGVPGDGREAFVWTRGAARTEVVGEGRLVLRARADVCAGAPVARVAVDGVVLGDVAVVNTEGWWEYPVGPPLAAGAHAVEVSYLDDEVGGAACDRNLHAGWVEMRGDVPAPAAALRPGPSPYVGAPPYADPASSSVAAAARSTGTRAQKELERRVAAQPTALWVGDWLAAEAARDRVARYASAARAAGRTGTVVLYAVPGRDCGGWSAGGLDAAGYRAWVRAVAAGLRGTGTTVVLEPDALAMLGDCDQGDRTGLLRDAVGVLADAGVVVYLDAGHSGWVPVATMAQRLRAAGVDRARGVALNVSGFGRTADERAYGEALSRAVGGARFVVDTSRNGRGPGSTWCNPTGRSLGEQPRGVADGTALDALLWVKPPGESDGRCGGGPAAGVWWPERARELAAATPWL